MHAHKVFLFNGPPHSGKDTLALELCHQLEAKGIVVYNRQPQTFKLPLLHLTIEFFGLYADREYILENYEKIKDSYTIGCYDLNLDPQVYKMSLREAMIYFSEKVYKPIFGKGIWGNRLMQRVNLGNAMIPSALVVSDLGFQDELDVVKRIYSPVNTHIIHVSENDDPLERQDWKNDSRRYVMDESVITSLIINDRTESPDELISDYLWSITL